jgi:CMP-N-acetylneuraminic acid synthetase
LGSVHLDKIVVSSEDEEIQEIAVNYSADLVIDRPKELASDSASSVDVALHSLDYCADQGETFDYLVLMQPTSPLRESRHIDDAFVLMKEKDARAVVGVCETEHPMSWMGKIPSTLSMDRFIERGRLGGDGQFQEGFDYQINGAIYVIEASELRQGKTFLLSRGTYAYVMRREESIDIDTRSQFALAEALHKSCLSEEL